jgi:DNA-binding transcriptional LysR family regulator
VALEALADRDWVLFPVDHGLYELIAFVCARVGFTPRGTVHTGQVAAAAPLAAAGLGVTLLPDNIVPEGLGAVRRLEQPIVREIAAFTRREFSPPVEAFLDVLRAEPWKDPPPNATVIAP